MAELVGGRYRCGRLLGHGGMSQVFAAIDEHDGSEVALKLIRPGDPQLARRLAQEARALERFDHPGLVRLRDAGTVDDQAFLVMDLVEGQTLASCLGHGPRHPARTAVLGAELASALAEVHRHGIVHRDVKPSNILVDSSGAVRLTDFGIARFTDATTVTLDGTTLGTAAYMAPEQLEDHLVGPPADIWSLGIVLVECLTGSRVFTGTATEVIAQRLSGPVPLPADLPVPWRLLLGGMLDHRPDHRPSASEVEALLASPAFHAPWSPREAPTPDLQRDTPVSDLTALVRPLGIGSGRSAPKSAPAGHPRGSVDLTAARDAQPTAARRTRTWLLDRGPSSQRLVRSRPFDSRPARIGLLGGITLAGLAALVVAALLSGPSGSGSLPPARSSSPPSSSRTAPLVAAAPPSSSSTTSSTTTTTTTTTTTVPSAAGALTQLVGQVGAGVHDGTISAARGQILTQLASAAYADVASANPDSAATDLSRLASDLASWTQDGSIPAATGTTLEGDLARFATALGLGAASVGSPSSSGPPAPTTSGPPGPGSSSGGPGHKGQNKS